MGKLVPTEELAKTQGMASTVCVGLRVLQDMTGMMDRLELWVDLVRLEALDLKE